jgi:[acyl-carrier-protein] S-malonyltransferase
LTVAAIFPGQGSQSVGMGKALAEASPEAREVWEQADAALGSPISTLAWEGPADQLDLTENAQPAILAASIAIISALGAGWKAAGVKVGPPAFYAGHSMGQYSALVASGALDLADGIRLVRRRGQLMQAATAGAMAAIIGLDDARLPELEAAGSAAGTFTIANRNSPGQVVVSGEKAAVEVAAAAAKELGAKRAIVLPVSVAAHSPLMADAAAGMREAIAAVTFRDPRAPLLANADARPLTTADACRGELVEHLTRGVDWVRAVQAMAATGVDTFLEVGPGKVLTGLVKRIAPDATAIALDEPGLPGAIRIPFTD